MAEIQSKLRLTDRVRLDEVVPLGTPYSIYLDPSSACNFKCSFCPTGHKDLIASSYTRTRMSYNVYQRVIEQLCEFDEPLKVLRLNKIGEPMLNKNLPNMIKLARDSGRIEWIDFATNGYLFSDKNIAEYVGSGVNRINISLEGLSTEGYKQNARVDINFDAFCGRLRDLYAEKVAVKNGGGATPEILIKIPGELLDSAGSSPSEFYEKFSEICDLMFVENLANIWPNFNLEERTDFDITDVGQYDVPSSEKLACTVILHSLTINSDGTVSACCSDWNQSLVLGNLSNQSIRDIWHGSEHLALIRAHLSGQRRALPECGNCGHIKHAQIDNIDDRIDIALERYNGV